MITFKCCLNEDMSGMFHSNPSILISEPLTGEQVKMIPLE